VTWCKRSNGTPEIAPDCCARAFVRVASEEENNRATEQSLAAAGTSDLRDGFELHRSFIDSTL